ncbi:ATP-dependent Clp protease ATP-binding subunit ClpC [Micromonospora pisi]|uniref:ATP-dependent Clp protease ATP-binding subunit ClpC n=1 Tax=Micromonospora pisi TaxID=589240 RepID=A0A495JN26_9ACTN|nr:Clp protease N-terminal domain-containing protein [Micromonospora pisi]RKR90221.1 ATP-dependent Clp protease ATP-binding subunit ClpC [Micromonospora pisi]
MPKINVYLPDELAEAVKESGVPVSAICQRALEQAVRRVTAIRETTLGETDADDPTAALTQFTPRARTAITLGVTQAGQEGATSLGTEHLLAGMLAEGQNLALQVLQAMEIDPEAVRRELARQATREPRAGDGSRARDGGRRFSRTAANALELTVTEATSLGHNYVGCEHLLLGLVAEPDGTAGHVLRALGADYRLTRRAVTAALAGYVHLRAQAQGAGPAGGGGTEATAALQAALTQQLQPIVARLERLEQRIDAGTATGTAPETA